METDILIAGIPAVALVMALSQVVKQYIASKFIPLISLVIGIALIALFQEGFSIDIFITGLTVGIAANGAFSGVKATFTK